MKLAIVTGASRGFGLALATRLRADGWHVAGLARTTASADDLEVDLTRPSELRGAVDAVAGRARGESITELIVVHNAASIGPLRASGALDAVAVTDAVAINLTACTLLFDAVIARWQSLPGRKVLAAISSGAAVTPHAGLSIYAATKAAVEQHVRVLAVEQGARPHPFVPIIVDPGAMNTDMQGSLRAASASDVPAAPEFARRYREGSLASVASVAAWAADLLRSPAVSAGGRFRVRDGLPT